MMSEIVRANPMTPGLMEMAYRCSTQRPLEGLVKEVYHLQNRYEMLEHLTGEIIATLTIEANQPEFEKIPGFQEIAKRWARYFEEITCPQ